MRVLRSHCGTLAQASEWQRPVLHPGRSLPQYVSVRRSDEQWSRASAVSVTGHWALKYGDCNPLTRYAFGWPFGKIVVRNRHVILDARWPFGALNHFLLRRPKY